MYYDDEEESCTQIINEMKNLQRAQITPRKMVESKGTQSTEKHNERQNNTKQNEKSCVMQGNSYKNRKQGENAIVYGSTTSNSATKDAPMQSYPSKHMQ